ncbi:putative polyhydroxyalkanoic acid system protein [gamma proteobacterium HTCC5015]|nr:putative polyhydroxyalkanoic acid system protein [gamma proteobacterium HTCC5015]
MSQIHIARKHPFSIEEAKQRLEVLRDRLRDKAGIQSQWNGNDLAIKGRGASGKIALSHDTIDVQLKLSMMLSPLKSTIEQKIHEGLDKAIDDAAS